MKEPKEILFHYLNQERSTVAWKLQDISDRAARTPMTPTGSTLLGIVKHLATMEYGYFGAAFDRPAPEEMPWNDPSQWEENADMWATAQQDLPWISGLYARSIEHANVTIAARDLDAPAVVPWWRPDRRRTTLGRILVHMIAETGRHAGHIDIIRELLDGKVGRLPHSSDIPEHDEAWWSAYRAKLDALAAAAPAG